MKGVQINFQEPCPLTILPPNALRRDCNGKCIKLIEGHALEVVVEVYITVVFCVMLLAYIY